MLDCADEHCGSRMPMETAVGCYDGCHEEHVEHPEETNIIAACERGLGESISFGRFSLDTFSWVRRSSFNHNQYQEELENFSMPGSVREKKAYFEAYYKALAKKKALERALAEGLCATEDQNIDNMGYAAIVEQCDELEQALGHSTVASTLEGNPGKVDAEASNNSLMGNLEGEAEDRHLTLSSQGCVDVDDSRESVPLQPEHDRKKVLPQLSTGKCEEQGFVLHMFAIQETQEDGHNTAVEKVHDQKCLEILDKIKVDEDLNHTGNRMPGLTELPAQKKSGSKHKTGTVVREKSSQYDSQESKFRLSSSSSATVKTVPRAAMKYGTERTNRKQTRIKVSNDVKSLTHQGPLDSGNSHSNFTVPQPFALATDKRASLAVQLPEHNATASPLQNGSVQVFSASKNIQASTKVAGKLEQKHAAAKLSQGRLKSLDEILKTNTPEIEAKEHKDGGISVTPIVMRSGSGQKLKANYSKASANIFNFKSDARAAKRKEFNSKLEERLNAKEAEKNQAEAKTQVWFLVVSVNIGTLGPCEFFHSFRVFAH
eukprot:c26531_g1_i4 orf=623-2254(-)